MSTENPNKGVFFLSGADIVDGVLLSSVVQTFVTGLYTLIFFQALVLLIKQRKICIAGCLTALYIAVIINLTMENLIIRTTFLGPLGSNLLLYGQIQNAVSALAAIIADSLLSWRCYIILKRNKWILATGMLTISAEIILLPIWLANSLELTAPHLSFVVFYWFFSLAITTVSTTLIVYRIISMAQKTNRTTAYYRTVEILVESGAMYTTVIIICCALWGQSKPSWDGVIGGGVYITSDLFYSLLIPVTGIAPTLITLRVASGRARGS
ncbi:hypothetical protein HYPSUDRAFT_421362 [Hypholoma sublateritium FD-334 SS-4]|uniref:Uncharacterized protein n=1 Tax=Hypholoma sublateritium (strain FD-334 SS-4) TaxID=945553 RepID=A0A0D2P9L6_HYPSF|nr:hypothetical protein HYPSUDRAFT_421362 [Hypholoma sublateritium FD-334 SS-4]